MSASEATVAAPQQASAQERIRGQRREMALGRVALAALFLAAGASVIYLAFSSGGYFPNATGLAAIVFAQALVLRTTLAERPFEGFGWALNIPLAALALYAGWELASSLWSPTPARALDAYDRTLMYLLAFTLFGSLAHSRARLRWLIVTLTVALTAVCVAGLLSRVLPHVWPTSGQFVANRLNYPLSYWNGEGMVAAVALIFLVHLASEARGHWAVRVLASALAPPVAAALLLTFSRGPLGAAVIGLIVYALLARPPGLPAATIALAPTVAVTVRVAYNADLLAQKNITSPAALAQGHHVAVLTGICMLGAAALRAALVPLDSRLVGRAWPAVLRDRRRRHALAGVAALLIILVAVAAGAPAALRREYHGFVHGNPNPQTSLLRDRFTNPSNNARLGLWQTALRAYDVHKLAGFGAGAFAVEYPRYRPADEYQYVTDAHSLYLQSMAELGLVGLVLILVVVGGVLVGLATRIRGPGRAAPAALFAAVLAWAIHGLVDWDWEMPVTTLWLFMACGLALASPRGRSRLTGIPRNRTALAVGWLVVAVAPLLGTLSYSRVVNTARAVARNDCTAAKQAAFSSMSLLAVRPQPYVAIGVCDLRQGFPAAAAAAMQKAVSYDTENWQQQYWLATARAAAGMDPRQAARRAQAANPHEPLTATLISALGSDQPQSWERAAPGLVTKALASGPFSLSSP